MDVSGKPSLTLVVTAYDEPREARVISLERWVRARPDPATNAAVQGATGGGDAESTLTPRDAA